MEAKIELDTVLDLVMDHQVALAEVIDDQMNGSVAYRLLWDEYKSLSELYDTIRRAAE